LRDGRSTSSTETILEPPKGRKAKRTAGFGLLLTLRVAYILRGLRLRKCRIMTEFDVALDVEESFKERSKMARVLIVDDDALVLETLTHMMESAGYTVITAVDGKQGIRTCQNEKPDLVIVDMIMPEMEGLETIKQLKSCHPAMKIIAISGGGSLRPKDYLYLARKLGAHASVTKPCTRDELVNVAKKLLESP
jgi:CheY-like chemotaxis protein